MEHLPNDVFLRSAVIATLVLYFLFGYFIVHSNVAVLARKVRITLKYKRISFSLFMYGLMEAFVILFVYTCWLGLLFWALLNQVPAIWRKRKTDNGNV